MFNPFKIIKYQLYLLQLENYELGRFWKLLFGKGLLPPKEGMRKELVWTPKAKALILMAIGLHLLIGIALVEVNTLSLYLVGIIWLLFILFYFILFTISLLLLWPFDAVAKKRIISRAKIKLAGLKNIKVIAVAGSYGKTTMKAVLETALGNSPTVAATPESVNTPVGIARWIIKAVSGQTKIIIVEMGEHYKGDVKALCEIVRPDVAVITGINESHLERMGSLENITETIFELAENSKEGVSLILNADDKNVISNYKNFTEGKNVQFYSATNMGFSELKILNQNFHQDGSGISFEIQNNGEFKVPLLGEYAIGVVEACIIIGKELGIGNQVIKNSLLRLKPIEHRLQPIFSPNNLLIIDDSYNGNPAGVKQAINTLAKFKNRRKIYITPGLVEMGKASETVHREIGKQLAQVADVVILIRNSVTPWVEEGIRNHELGIRENKPQVIWFDTALEAHAALRNILQPFDLILFQNDWGDQYL